MNTPPEIRDFNFPRDGDEDVFRLDVSVDDVFFVEVGEGERHLMDVG